MGADSSIDPFAKTAPPLDEVQGPPGLQPGTLIGESYEIEGLLGRGGMGAVYRATHRKLHRPFAVKVVRTADARDARSAMRLVQEARTASGIRHDHIVDVTDLGHDEGLVYVVMELLEGEDLSERIARAHGEPLPDEEVERVVDEILAGVAAAHRRGVIHRDLKPANVFLSAREDRTVVKLLDFGMSKLLENESSVQLTHTGQLVGTPLYMSPEQSRGAELDHRSDIYSLGVLMFELLAGEVPFPGRTIYELVLKHTTEEPPRLSERRPDLPPEIVSLVHRCLEKDPENRWSSTEELRRAWRRAWGQPSLELTAVDAPSDPAAARGRTFLPWVVAGALAALGAVAWFAMSSSDPAPVSRSGAARAADPAAWPQAEAQPSVDPVTVEPEPEPAPDDATPELVERRVRLESAPPGATVLLGDRELGTTPLEVEVPPADEISMVYRVQLDGYRARTVTVTPDTEDPLQVDLTPRRGRRAPARRPPAGEGTSGSSRRSDLDLLGPNIYEEPR